MNITSVNTTGAKNTGIYNNREDSTPFWKKGTVLEGMVTDITEQVSVDFGGKEVKLPADSIKNPKVGEKRSFEVLDASEGKVTLRELNNQNAGEKQTAKICCTIVDTDPGVFQEMMDKKADKKNSDEDEGALHHAADTMTGEDYNALSEEGMSLEKFEAGRLERALERMKEQKVFRTENLETRIINQEQYREEIKEIAVQNRIPEGVAGCIVEKLLEADLPVTDENISRMVNALGLSQSVTDMTDTAKAYLISAGQEFTLEHIYHAQHSGYCAKAEGSWEEIKEAVNAVIEKSGLQITEETVAQGKWLYENNLPVTEESFHKLAVLNSIQKDMTDDMLLYKMTEAMKAGGTPQQANLDITQEAAVQKAVEEWHKVSDEALKQVIAAGKEITLFHLKEAEKTVAVQENVNVQETAAGYDMSDARLLTARRQLEEIRLKMTLEAGMRLAKSGINLDTTELQRIVEGLREKENQYYENLLKEAGITTPDANETALLKETIGKIDDLKQSPAYVLGTTLRQRELQTINTLHNEAMSMKAQLDKAETTYEALMTVPRKDMGDSIQKAFRNVDPLLVSMDMELTDANRRAVRILGYNSMEITEENIDRVKGYDQQVNHLIKEMHPAVTVELIRRGINPLEKTIPELEENIASIKEELGITDEEKYSTYLWKLDKQDGITADERKSYIGIYRLLNNIEKTDGAAIGSVVNAGNDVTLRNLLTAVRTLKHSGIDQKVDEEFGGIENITYNSESITAQIATAYDRQAEKVTYLNQLVEDIMEDITPDKVAKLAENDIDSILDMSLERLGEELENISEDKQTAVKYGNEMAQRIRNIVKDCHEAVNYLEMFHQPVSLQNVEAVQTYFAGNGNLFGDILTQAEKASSNEKENVEDVFSGLTNAMENADTFIEQYDSMNKQLEGVLSKGYEQPEVTTDVLDQMRIMKNGIRLATGLSRQEHYRIPMVMGEEVANISLTIVHGRKETGKVEIGFVSDSYGKIECELTVKEQELKGFVLCETTDGKEKIENCSEQLQSRLEELGLTVKSFTVVTDKAGIAAYKHQQSGTTVEDKADTRMLYQSAKAFLESIRTTDNME